MDVFGLQHLTNILYRKDDLPTVSNYFIGGQKKKI